MGFSGIVPVGFSVENLVATYLPTLICAMVDGWGLGFNDRTLYGQSRRQSPVRIKETEWSGKGRKKARQQPARGGGPVFYTLAR